MHLFVFSDDIPWVRKNAFFEHETTFVKLIGGSSPVEEMWLMSLCCHNVIANSSFSWWGAWLNSNEDKMVIAPSLWFKSEDKDTRDLIPECWTRL